MGCGFTFTVQMRRGEKLQHKVFALTGFKFLEMTPKKAQMITQQVELEFFQFQYQYWKIALKMLYWHQ